MPPRLRLKRSTLCSSYITSVGGGRSSPLLGVSLRSLAYGLRSSLVPPSLRLPHSLRGGRDRASMPDRSPPSVNAVKAIVMLAPLAGSLSLRDDWLGHPRDRVLCCTARCRWLDPGLRCNIRAVLRRPTMGPPAPLLAIGMAGSGPPCPAEAPCGRVRWPLRGRTDKTQRALATLQPTSTKGAT